MPGLVREVVVMQETMTLTLSYRGKEEYSVPVSWKGPLSDCSVRDMREIAGVLADPDCFVTGLAYYMYRDITRSDADRQWLQAQQRLITRQNLIPVGALKSCQAHRLSQKTIDRKGDGAQ